jgi:hypothetical protein
MFRLPNARSAMLDQENGSGEVAAEIVTGAIKTTVR